MLPSHPESFITPDAKQQRTTTPNAVDQPQSSSRRQEATQAGRKHADTPRSLSQSLSLYMLRRPSFAESAARTHCLLLRGAKAHHQRRCEVLMGMTMPTV
ncbi:hypothetical protein CVT26_012807 [Gymnopilus dilepis]|uniref:Uncharacterized protein n=1 Tax=Gymnopilus dilepis TaxID=231916 RepID=A0A409Y458_9AGAR|nr:hypothetical protein CVT26_012807 [Gymnopilus dilepis]